MLDSIKNVRLRDLGKIPPQEQKQYAEVLQFLRAEPFLGKREAKKLIEMEFAEVQNIRTWIQSEQNVLKAMALYYDCDEERITDYRLIDFWKGLNHLKREIVYIDKIEKVNLHRKPSTKMLDAGIEQLNQFGALNVLDGLARDYGKSPQEIEQWSYGLVFSIQWKRRIESDIDNNLKENK